MALSYQRIASEIDRGVFIPSVSDRVQNAGQSIIDAIKARDVDALHSIALRYQKYEGMAQGGGGAGPGRMKNPPRGTVTVSKMATEALALLREGLN